MLTFETTGARTNPAKGENVCAKANN